MHACTCLATPAEKRSWKWTRKVGDDSLIPFSMTDTSSCQTADCARNGEERGGAPVEATGSSSASLVLVGTLVACLLSFITIIVLVNTFFRDRRHTRVYQAPIGTSAPFSTNNIAITEMDAACNQSQSRSLLVGVSAHGSKPIHVLVVNPYKSSS